MKRLLGVAVFVAAAGPAFAQGAAGEPANPNAAVGSARAIYEIAKGYVVRAADQMPEENYAFRPTAEVRNFAELIAHIANANYLFCSSALKEEDPHKEDFEKTRAAKPALVEALRASFEYCDRAYGIADAASLETIDLFGGQRTRLAVLILNAAHDFEHYGNIVTYMRLKGLVPPSSQRMAS
ncbi:MAG: DinB family protein [Gemmatimonadetes bacterium]|nr:DinB family protein [Gemmatimonadota bacterium]